MKICGMSKLSLFHTLVFLKLKLLSIFKKVLFMGEPAHE